MIAIVISLTALITFLVFNTAFANLTVDVWAFAASLFLVIEASYKITSSKDAFWPSQFFRFIRIVIGVTIFTIHICQVIYGQ